MAYCRNCGAQIDDNDLECPECNSIQQIQSNKLDEIPSFWFIMGFVLPIIGLMAFVMYGEAQPRKAKSAGVGALSSVCLLVIFSLLYRFFKNN